jgi:hypothetical protein
VVEAAYDNEKLGPLVESMDRTGKVNGALKKRNAASDLHATRSAATRQQWEASNL